MISDALIIGFDRALRTVTGHSVAVRPNPAAAVAENQLDEAEKQLSASLMRVNHCGEVCAQALYQGQALTCRTPEIRQALAGAAAEEIDHLAWSAARIAELGGRTSLLNPLWYGGALLIGAVAGKAGDGWNLGFLSETERQVEAHLDSHLLRLPEADLRSRAIVRQMRDDEVSHADMADDLGARALPVLVRMAMRLSAKLMTGLTHYV